MATVTEMRLGEGRDPDASRYRFNYKGFHRYLITLETHKVRPTFTEPDHVLKILGVLRDTGLSKGFDVYAYCFLPDRLVLIARGKNDDADMKAFLHQFRASSDELLRPVLGGALWKKTYTERVLRKAEDSKKVAAEVFQLSVKAGLAKTAEEYPFHGSFVTDTEAPAKKPWTPQQRAPRKEWKKGARPAGGRAKPGRDDRGRRPRPPGKPAA